MYYHFSVVWQMTRLSTTQTVYDEFTYHFNEIIRHAEIYIKCKAVQQCSFTIEVGAVPPLYLTATKCRIPSLRRRALDLLSKAPRKECNWGARSTAEIVARVIAVEEEGLGLPTPDCGGKCANVALDDGILPSEEQRVHTLEILKNESTQGHEVRVTRYTPVDGRLWRRVQDFPL